MPTSDNQSHVDNAPASASANATGRTEQLFEDDPVLGQFVAYYPSNRTRLLIRAGIAYIVPVLFLQLFFANLDDATASILLIGSFTALALAVGWYITHLWNREVVIYERGFTYREGSRAVPFLFLQIVRVNLRAERIRLFGVWRRDIYEYRLVSDEDEHIRLNNIYKDIAELGLRLERAITKARRPIVNAQLARGERVLFSAEFILSGDGITVDNQHLDWRDFMDYKLEAGYIELLTWQPDEDQAGPTQDGEVWAQVPLKSLENEMLLVELLKERRKRKRDTTT